LKVDDRISKQVSALRQRPVQLHLINPQASYFGKADLLIAADYTAYTLGAFHHSYLRSMSIAIACPKLDSDKEIYIDKIIAMIDQSMVKTITVMIMRVPCYTGLLKMVISAVPTASRKVQVNLIVTGIEGLVLKEE
jgi:hypothetical protein